MTHTIIDLLIWTFVFVIALIILLFNYKKRKTYIFIDYRRKTTYAVLIAVITCFWLFGGLFILDSLLHS